MATLQRMKSPEYPINTMNARREVLKRKQGCIITCSESGINGGGVLLVYSSKDGCQRDCPVSERSDGSHEADYGTSELDVLACIYRTIFLGRHGGAVHLRYHCAKGRFFSKSAICRPARCKSSWAGINTLLFT